MDSALDRNASMRDRIESFGWASTSMGPRETWPESLLTVLSLALNTSFAMMIMWGPDLVQIYNEGYVPILGDKHPASLGQGAEACWNDIWNSVGPMLRGVYDRGEPVYYENLPLQMQRHGGYEEAFFTFSYSPIYDGGVVAGIICVVSETTAHVLREREFAERATALAELDRAKTEFFSNVSHEFRTPLTLMLGPLDELRRDVEPRNAPLVDMTKRNALRLLKLVNTLLEFARIEAGRVDPLYQPTDLGAFTRELANVFRPAVESSGLRFDVRVEPVGTVAIDRNMWERIVFNLLSNALKFTIDGSISLEFRATNGEIRLDVRDTGSGIAPDDLANVFERFHRARNAPASRSHEGSGIGLALVQELVRLHDGTIAVESELGIGTTFSIALPSVPLTAATGDADEFALAAAPTLAAQYLAEVEALAQPLGGTSHVGDDAPTASREPKRQRLGSILLADDNADLRAFVSRVLSPHHDVTLAKNGREALEIARARRFDLIISDVMMPELDGFGLLDALRAEPATSRTPFIMLSARAGEEAAVGALARGADDYLMKPFSSDDLLGRVDAHLNAATLREKVIADLRESEERFRALTASMPHIVVESNGFGNLVYASDAFAAYTGRPISRALGDGWMSFMHHDDRPEAVVSWNRSMETGDPFIAEFRYRRADGTYRWHVAHVLAQHGADGALVRWTGTITDRHEARTAIDEREALARASRSLSESLDLATTLRTVAKVAVPRFADWVQIDLRTEHGTIETVAIAHGEAAKNAFAQSFVGREHINVEADVGSPFVIRTGQHYLVESFPMEALESAVLDEETRAMYRKLGLVSAIAVPLVANDRTLGALSAVYSESGRHYTHEDLPLLEELGRRAGLAIENASAFQREHRVADSFQHASLPNALPTVRGLRFDAIYSPGSAEALVGGDWYDAVRLFDGRIVISIGDVLGSGLDAAVTMGNVRQIIRGIAQVHADPALMLDAADRALRLEHDSKFVTAFVAVLDPIAGTLAYASAGHPPPILRHPDGRIEALGDGGLPLGLRDSRDLGDGRSVDITRGSQLVLYTDGLTESSRDALAGEERLREIVAGGAFLEAERPAHFIRETFLGGKRGTDDIAILVIGIDADPTADTDASDVQHWVFDVLDVRAARAARTEFRTALAARKIDAQRAHAAELVFGELVGNVARYAPGSVRVSVDWTTVPPVLHVIDDGPGFQHLALLPNDVYSESGRGLYLVSTLTRDFHVAKRPRGGSHARAVLAV